MVVGVVMRENAVYDSCEAKKKGKEAKIRDKGECENEKRSEKIG